MEQRISTIAGFPKDPYSVFFHSRARINKEIRILNKMCKEANNFQTFLEILTKSLVYRELYLETSYFAFEDQETGEAVYYTVFEKIVTEKGCTAYLLTSGKGRPTVFVISGSQFHPSGLDALSSYINDFLWSIGEEAFRVAEERIVSILGGLGSPVIVCGHSLGGVIAQLLTACYPKFVKELHTWNSPGISEKYHIDFSNVDHIPIHIHRTKWDFVQWVGGYHLRGSNKVTYVQYEVGDLFTIPHTYLCLANPCDITIQSMEAKSPFHKDIERELEEEYSPCLEWTRKLVGCIIVPVLVGFRFIVRQCVPSRASMVQVDE